MKRKRTVGSRTVCYLLFGNSDNPPKVLSSPFKAAMVRDNHVMLEVFNYFFRPEYLLPLYSTCKAIQRHMGKLILEWIKMNLITWIPTASDVTGFKLEDIPWDFCNACADLWVGIERGMFTKRAARLALPQTDEHLFMVGLDIFLTQAALKRCGENHDSSVTRTELTAGFSIRHPCEVIFWERPSSELIELDISVCNECVTSMCNNLVWEWPRSTFHSKFENILLQYDRLLRPTFLEFFLLELRCHSKHCDKSCKNLYPYIRETWLPGGFKLIKDEWLEYVLVIYFFFLLKDPLHHLFCG